MDMCSITVCVENFMHFMQDITLSTLLNFLMFFLI